MTSIALICPRVRIEEKAILSAFETRNVRSEPVNPATLSLEWGTSPLPGFDAAFLSGVEPGQASFLSQWLEGAGIHAINPSPVARRLADRVALHLTLWDADLPTPSASVAFSADAAIEAIERIGYPVCDCPIDPSDGVLTARLNDRSAATAVIEHRRRLGGYRHGVTYIERAPHETVARHCFLVAHGQVIATDAPGLSADRLGHLAGLAGRAVGGGIVTVIIESTADDRAWICDVASPSRFREIGIVKEIAERIAEHVLEEVAMQDSSER